ncbi:MAG: diguanylate cyclase [Rhodocyclaceae bacterium]|nr:diguanylate cyclase [Rhodocyclaceae bacterium]
MRVAERFIGRVKAWLNASLGNRIGAALLSLTLGFILLLGIANFVYIFSLTRDATRAALNESTRDAVNDVSTVLAGINDDLHNLARNPTVVSAVLDSVGQESYLYPLLLRFKPAGRVARNLCVTDYKGKSIGCSRQPMPSYSGQPWVVDAVESNRASAHIVMLEPLRPLLQIAQPVVYEGTGRAEGAVVAEYELSEIFIQALGGAAEQFTHLHLKGAAGDLLLRGHGEDIVHVERKLALAGPFDSLKLSLSLGVPSDRIVAPLRNLAAVFTALVIMLVAAVFALVRYLVPRLTRRLSAITRQAQQVAETGVLEYADTDRGRDEIARLSQAFATMTHRLQEINQTLEGTVAARTDELRQQQALLKSIMNAVPGVIFQFCRHPDGKISMPFASNVIQQVYGLDPALLREDAAQAFAMVHPDDRAALYASIEESAEQLTAWRHECRIVGCERAVSWCLTNALPQRLGDGSVLWHGMVMDITEHKRAELALAESEAYSKALFENSYMPMVIMDSVTGRFVDCNDAAVAIYGYPDRQSVLGKTPLDVSAPTQYDGSPSSSAAAERIANAEAAGVCVFEWRHRRPDGVVWDAEVRLMKMSHRGRQLMQFSLIDITERKRLESERKAHEDLIWRQANFDALTGLANRNLCHDRLEGALAQARRSGRKVGVIFLDLDGFKSVNDSIGHALGDELLVEVARRLTDAVREQDTVARLGGDEFVLLAHDLASAEDMLRIGEKIVATLQQPFSLAGMLFVISASVGCALFPDDAAGGEALLDLADQAMYQAKQAGKNCVRCAGQ